MNEEIISKVELYITENLNIDISYLKDFSIEFSNIPEIRVYYIYALYKLNQFELGIQELNKINDLIYLQKNHFYIMVKNLLEKRDNTEIDELIKILEDCLKLDVHKKNKWLRLELFNLYEKKELDYMAWKYLEEAISIDENFWEAILKRALGLSLIENCNDIINQILQLPQTYVDADVLNFLGNAYLNCNNINNAVKIFNGSLEISKTEEAYYFLGYINHYNFKDYDKALLYYDESISLNNLFIDALIEKAWLKFDMVNHLEAENLFKEIIVKDGSLHSYNQIILFYLKVNKNSDALNYVYESKNNLGINYMNDGFELICLERLKNTNYIDKYKEYKKKYSDEEMLWFKSLLNEI